jgi:hypothetical protein
LQDHEDKITQIAVIHDDLFVRTYTVSSEAFEIVRKDQADLPREKQYTQCFVEESTQPESEIQEKVQFMLERRPYLGGCRKGSKHLESKGPEAFVDRLLQVWDTTEAAWFSGKVMGMWKGKKLTHWLVLCSDDTEYSVDAACDVWKLVRSRLATSTQGHDMLGLNCWTMLTSIVLCMILVRSSSFTGFCKCHVVSMHVLCCATTDPRLHASRCMHGNVSRGMNHAS